NDLSRGRERERSETVRRGPRLRRSVVRPVHPELRTLDVGPDDGAAAWIPGDAFTQNAPGVHEELGRVGPGFSAHAAKFYAASCLRSTRDRATSGLVLAIRREPHVRQ